MQKNLLSRPPHHCQLSHPNNEMLIRSYGPHGTHQNDVVGEVKGKTHARMCRRGQGPLRICVRPCGVNDSTARAYREQSKQLRSRVYYYHRGQRRRGAKRVIKRKLQVGHDKERNSFINTSPNVFNNKNIPAYFLRSKY